MNDVTILTSLIWVMISAALVFLMQAGFLCLETGLTRSKNNINVAIKNMADFGISTVLYWAFGFALMFGITRGGWFGSSGFALSFDLNDPELTAFFVFQVMFCGTAVTILSGAVAERLRFGGYLLLAILVAGLTYPIFGHWAWSVAEAGETAGWLANLGFVDFAGSTVVHSVGGWTALAVLLIIGARSGRFPSDGPPRRIPGANIPVAALGVLLLYVGWIGFNGGSTLAVNQQTASVVANTILAGSVGMVTAIIAAVFLHGNVDVSFVMNGALAGLVAITASANSVTAVLAVIIGAIGSLVMIGVDQLLERLQIDDAVGAIPVHLGAGIWGTLAVGLFGSQVLLGTGLSRFAQIGIQLLGILVCFIWVFGITYLLVRFVDRLSPLRVSAEEEHIGLNISQHDASTELVDLFMAMDSQTKTGDLSLRVPVEPFTEVGQIASRYNQLMESLEQALARTQTVVKNAMDGIIILSAGTLEISTLNPAAEAMFGLQESTVTGQPVTKLLRSHSAQDEEKSSTFDQFKTWLFESTTSGHPYEIVGQRSDGVTFPIEATIADAELGAEQVYIGTLRDISQRKQVERELRQYREQLEELVQMRTAELIEANKELQRARDGAEAANKAISSFSTELDTSIILHTICRELARALGLPRADFGLLDESRRSLAIIAEHVDEGLKSALGGNIPVDLEGSPYDQQTLIDKQPLIIHNAQFDSVHKGLHGTPYKRKSASMLVVPLVVNDEAIGSLALHSAEAYDFTESDIALATNVTTVAGQALQRAHLYEALEIELAERRRIETQLQRAMTDAESANRAKSSFLANMSHELRTPMNAIIGYSEILIEDAIDEDHRDMIPDLERINTAAHHLLDLINDVLDLSKIEAGRVDLYLERFDLSQMLDETATTIQPLVSRNNNRLVTNFSDNLGSARADLPKLRQALTNLLSNAAKFTAEGTVTLTAKREKRQGNDWIVIAVADTGIGIDTSKIEQIFDEFTQADDSISKNYGGTGLGLAISRRYCRMMGGDISVESDVGKGSTFTIEIPAEVKILEAVREIEVPEVKEREIASGSETNLLIINAHKSDRELMSSILEAAGYNLVASESGTQGLEFARRLKPALIILDLILPDIDGWVVLRNLKGDVETERIPVVVVSAVGSLDLAYDLGAANSLTKPVDGQQLLQTVHHILRPGEDATTSPADDDQTYR